MDVLTVLSGGSTPVTLRRAAEPDVPAIVALLAADQLGATRDGVHTPADLAAYQQAFRAIDADPAHLLVVGEAAMLPTPEQTPERATGSRTQARSPEVVATMQLSFLPGLARHGALRAQIEAVRVRGDFRGGGLGAAMFTWAIEEARRQGCALVQLTTDKSRASAHRFYERLGFVASHEGMKLTL
jgi:GNAT superfamily N-acetyltransferase